MFSFLLTEANLNESEVPRVVENLYILVCCRLRVLTTAGDTRWCLLSREQKGQMQTTEDRRSYYLLFKNDKEYCLACGVEKY